MAKHTIKPLVSVETDAPKPAFTYLMGWGQRMTTKGYIWYIEGPKENIIVDTGCEIEKLNNAGFTSKQIATPEEALSQVGLKCEDIDIVIVTHLHFDHIELAHKYPNAKFIVQKAELDDALNPHDGYKWVYDKALLDGVNFEVVDGDHEIVEGVRVLLTPGHSKGGQSIAVDTDEGRTVIPGFCCIRRNFEPPEPINQVMPVIVPGIQFDFVQLYESMQRIKKEADIILPLHEANLAMVPSIL